MKKSTAVLREEIETLKLNNRNLRKTVEDQKVLIAELEQSRKYFEALLESIPAGVFLSDRDGRLVKVNDYGLKIWGNTIPISESWQEYKEWIGYNADTGRRLAAEDWAASRALTRGEVTLIDVIDIERFDGTRGTIINSSAPVRDDDGNITGAITVDIDITKQRQAERDLRESLEKYQALIETNVDFIWEIDTGGRYTYCSPQMEKLWNLKPADMIGKTPVDAVKPGDKAELSAFLKKLIENPASFHNLKSEALDGNGNTVYVEISGVPFYGEHGELGGYRGVTKDISERVLTEQALKESHQISRQRLAELENIYNTSSIGLTVLDLNATYLKVNDVLAKINGIPAEDHIGKTVFDIIPSLSEQVREIISKIIETDKPLFGIEFIGKSQDKPELVKYFSEDWLPVRDASGRITAFNVAVVETTEQKQAHEEVLQRNKQLTEVKRALERTQRKLNLALENGNIGIWELDLATNIFTGDDRLMRMFEAKTHIATIEELESLIDGEDVHFVKNVLRKSIESEDPVEAIFRTNPQLGPTRYISSRAVVIKNKNEKPVKVLGVCFDITSFARESEKNLLKLNEELQRSNRDLEQFAYIASHDLQEPLRMIASFNQLLQLKYADKLDADANEYIRYAVDGSKRMYELLNGLLAYSRVSSKGSAFALVDMNNIIEVVLDNLRLSIEEKSAQITADQLPGINADRSQMIQILQNLVENALKFSRGKPVIRLTYSDRDAFHSFSVMDNGIGIEEQYHDRIFRIFQRLNTQDHPGSGMGLAVCKRIAERHGGKIWVESKPGEGSVFTFTILKELNLQKHD